MNNWILSALIATFLAVLGKAFDSFMLNKKKTALYNLMISWWDQLDDTKIPNFPKLMSKWIISLKNKFFKRSLFYWKNLILMFILSFILTTIFDLVTMQLGLSAEVSSQGVLIPLFPGSLYFVNFLFDIPTFYITYKLINKIYSSSYIKSMFLIFLDLIIATLLAVFCSISLLYMNTVSVNYLKIESYPYTNQLKEYISEEYKSKLSELGYTEENSLKLKLYNDPFLNDLLFHPNKTFKSIIENKIYRYHRNIELSWIFENQFKSFTIGVTQTQPLNLFIMSMTSLLPSAIYLFILFLMLLSKLMIDISKKVTMYFIEIATQVNPTTEIKDFKPGSLFGILLSLLTIMFQIIAQFKEGLK